MGWKEELARKHGYDVGRGSGRTRHVAGVRNQTEIAFEGQLMARKFAGEILSFEFEGVKLRIGDRCWYTPDFVCWLAGGGMIAYEVKGHWEDDARVKIKAAASRYPQIRFIAVKKTRSGWEMEEIKSR